MTHANEVIIISPNKLSLFLSSSDIYFRTEDETIIRFDIQEWGYILSEEFQRFSSEVIDMFQNLSAPFNKEKEERLKNSFGDSFEMEQTWKNRLYRVEHLIGWTEKSIMYTLMVEWSDIHLDVIKEEDGIVSLEFHIFDEEIPLLTITPSEWETIKTLRENILSYLLPNPEFNLLT